MIIITLNDNLTYVCAVKPEESSHYNADYIFYKDS